MSGDEWTIDSKHSYHAYLKHLDKQFNDHGYLSVKMKTGKQLTDKQFNAMHVFIRHTVAELNERGITFTEFFNDGFEVPWTEEIFKKHCWKPLQKAIMKDNKTKSTKDQTRDIPGKIHQTLTAKFSAWGFYVQWPVEKRDK